MKETIIIAVAALLAAGGIAIALVLSLSDCPMETTRTDDSSDVYFSQNITVNNTLNITFPVNLAFVYDKSFSMLAANIRVEQESIEGMIREFNTTLGPGMLTTGVISYGCAALVEVSPTTDLGRAIRRTHTSGTTREPCTRTDLAFQAYEDMAWPRSAFSSPEKVKNVLVLLSDGAVFPPELYRPALAESTAIKDSGTTIFSIYVQQAASTQAAGEMLSFSSCETPGAESASECLFYFTGNFSALQAASSRLASELATNIAVIEDTEEIILVRQNVSTIKSTSENSQCIYDRRWLLALILMLPLLVYGCYSCCFSCCWEAASGAAEAVGGSKSEEVDTPAVGPEPPAAESHSNLFPVGAPGEGALRTQAASDTGYVPPARHPIVPVFGRASTAGGAVPYVLGARGTTAGAFAGHLPQTTSTQETDIDPGAPVQLPAEGIPAVMPAAGAENASKKKWSTVKTDHYIWSMGGGATKLSVDFGKGFDSSSLPSAPSAVDRSGQVVYQGDVCSEFSETSGGSANVALEQGVANSATSSEYTQEVGSSHAAGTWGGAWGLFQAPAVSMTRTVVQEEGGTGVAHLPSDEEQAAGGAGYEEERLSPEGGWLSRLAGLFRCGGGRGGVNRVP